MAKNFGLRVTGLRVGNISGTPPTIVDTANPVITSSVPADNATGVAVADNIVVTFNEVIQFITAAGTFALRDNDGIWADLEVFTPSTTTSATGSGGGSASISNNVLTINPGSNLVNGIEHALRFAANVIEDTSSNAFAGIVDDTTLSFTAINSAPTASVFTPLDNATGVNVSANQTVQFNKNVEFDTVGGGTIILRSNNGGWATVETFTPSSASAGTGSAGGSISITTDTVTINPNADLTNSIEYAIRIDSTAIQETSGDGVNYAGIADDTTWSFTAAAAGGASRGQAQFVGFFNIYTKGT